MSHFARVENGFVTTVIVAEQDHINSLPDKELWIQTSYNTKGGQHPDGKPLRKNFAGVGYSYDPLRDAFIPPKPYNSSILNEDTCLWEYPVPCPDDGSFYLWDEQTLSWVEL